MKSKTTLIEVKRGDTVTYTPQAWRSEGNHYKYDCCNKSGQRLFKDVPITGFWNRMKAFFKRSMTIKEVIQIELRPYEPLIIDQIYKRNTIIGYWGTTSPRMFVVKRPGDNKYFILYEHDLDENVLFKIKKAMDEV